MSARCNKETKLLKAVAFYLNSSLFVLFGNQQKNCFNGKSDTFFFFQVESIKRFFLSMGPRWRYLHTKGINRTKWRMAALRSMEAYRSKAGRHRNHFNFKLVPAPDAQATYCTPRHMWILLGRRMKTKCDFLKDTRHTSTWRTIIGAIFEWNFLSFFFGRRWIKHQN